MALMFLSGDGMRGGRLHDQLGGAPLVAVTRTAPAYRCFAVAGRFPALRRVESGGGSFGGELYDLPLATLGRALLPAEPDDLELGAVELVDGAWALATVLRRDVPERGELADITDLGDWHAYRAARP
ncbi:allophanate hydrolase-related protein [Actinocatenispora rupis]|uniref:Allophanate hydrolase C-terminal domain-containing protein n=1 Tax=Actinocatenispora rupis TaxID=519421 RepID=A0A8J3J6L3_9ACTN|nr:gamma-glutamylcyclotransferase [Actinocatenispora rupis]GID11034.1 hypothetical protein Aru02nite_19230 [Actinocatenispora rupis]